MDIKAGFIPHISRLSLACSHLASKTTTALLIKINDLKTAELGLCRLLWFMF